MQACVWVENNDLTQASQTQVQVQKHSFMLPVQSRAQRDTAGFELPCGYSVRAPWAVCAVLLVYIY